MTSADTQTRFEPTTAAAITFVTVLTVASILSFVHRFVPAVLVDAIRADVAISDLQFGGLQSAFAVTYVFGTLASGWVADRTNRRNLIFASVAIWTAGSAIFALAPAYGGLWFGRMLVGLGEAVLAPAGISLLCDYLRPERRGRAIAAFYFGATLGTSLAFTGGGWLLERAADGAFAALPVFGTLAPWRQVVLFVAVLGVALLPCVLAFREPPRATVQAASAQARLDELWRSRVALALILVAGSSIAFADFSYTTWQTPLLTRGFELTTADAGRAVGAATFVAGVLGAWLGGVLSDRASSRGGVVARAALLQVCAAGLALSAALLLVPRPSAAIAAFACWQIVANVAYVACAVTLQDLVGDRNRALAASLATSLSIGLGMGLGPSVVAAMNAALGHGANALGPSVLVLLLAMATITFSTTTALKRRAALPRT